MRKTLTSIAAASALLLCIPAGLAMAASVISNGSFENGTDPGSFTTIANGDSTSITDWTVSSGDVDYIGTYWQAADGNRSIDLDGDTQGALSQTFPTNIGTKYNVTFDLSGNPDGAPSLKDVQVSATGGSPQDFTFNITANGGNSHSNMMWQPETYTFTANSANTTLTFASQVAGDFGPTLDNVAVVPSCTPITSSDVEAPTSAAVVAITGETITGTIDATGCDVGVFVGSGVSNVTVTATIHDANKVGVLVDNATNVTVTGSTISNIGNHTGGTFDPNGVQAGNGIRFTTNATGSVSNNTVSEYQKNGIAITHGSTANVTGNQVTGLGPVSFITANGIEMFAGASGSITGNTVSSNYCMHSSPGDDCTIDPTSDNSASDGAAGILVYTPAGTTNVTGNTLTGNQFSIWSVGATQLNANNNNITGTGGTTDTGIAVANTDGSATSAGTTGSIDHNTITNTDYGVLLLDFNTSGANEPAVTVNNNSLAGNTNDGAWTNVTKHTIDGNCNWWGDPSGPGPEGLGSGTHVTGNIDFDTFLATSNLSNSCSQPPVPMCPANLVPSASPVDTITVNSNQSTPTSGNTNLTNGQSYLLKSSGTWQNNTLNLADTAFASIDGWATHMQGYDISPFFLGPQEFQLQVNGAFVNWGPYDGVNHTYYHSYTGTGTAVSLMVFDGQNSVPNPAWYGDNNGNLAVNVYACVVPPPPANACATPKIAPAGYTLQTAKPGNPTLTLTPLTMFVGGAGNPTITGPAGNYILCLSNGDATVTLGDGSDTIKTGNGNQRITVGSGGAGASSITVGNGNSTISSTDSGNQTVTAGNGNQNITTGSGNDTIHAGNGNSKINAGPGTDSCTVGAGVSALTGCNP